jgi:D-alanyl-D-alanine carboxypeptidase/D-alanyl-D-alanine-endopeptidase (penicillin-binding protein 4)
MKSKRSVLSINFIQPTLFILLFVSFSSCQTTKSIQKTEEQITAQNLVTTSPVFNKNFTGFMLFDPETGDTLAAQFADKYMTPASNTKIYTLYTCIKVLGDSIPSLRYVIQGDDLIFWGTGDPTFAHPFFEETFGENRAVAFLKSWKGGLFYAPQFNKHRFGDGWAWDDYNGYYSTELSTFPIYSNFIRFRKYKGNEAPTTIPKYFEPFLNQQNGISKPTRNEIDNTVNHPAYGKDATYSKNIPFKVSNDVILELLEEATGKNIQFNWQLTAEMKAKQRTIYSYRTQDVLQQMMHPSDNFIAEQLLFVCASEKNLPLQTAKIIEFATDSLLQNLPDAPVWRDGSGMSRYNMFTPRSIVHVLNNLYQNIDTATLFTIFPTGGKSGTIKNLYAGNPPYVFAKTGTISNNHCLSGYIRTNSGKVLIFSFMNNHYVGSSSVYKAEMKRILEWIRDNN